MRSNSKIWVVSRELRQVGGYLKRAAEFLRSEISPFAKRNAEHVEIIQRYEVHGFLNCCRAPVRRALRIGAPCVIAFERERLREGGLIYSRQVLHANEELVVEGPALWHGVVCGIRKHKCHC